MPIKLIILSGLSGSGKSTALHALEDLNFYAVDNLPIKLFEHFTELAREGAPEYAKVALVMDLRDTSFVEHYPLIFRKILKNFKSVEILFLEASDDVLLRRFSETRRKHPLSKTSVVEGIAQERKLLQDLKDLATTIIDTSAMDVHALKKRIAKQFGSSDQQQMQIRMVSFGFKFGIPKNCDLIFDVRFFSNPHFVPELREFSGLHPVVGDYIEQDPHTAEFTQRTIDYLMYLIPHYAREGKSYLSIGIGCTGGKHRSVYLAKKLGEILKQKLNNAYPLSIEHQDLRF